MKIKRKKKLLFGFFIVLCVSICLIVAYIGKKSVKVSSGDYFRDPSEEEICEKENGIRYVDSELLLTAEENVSKEEIKQILKISDEEIVGFISATNDYQVHFIEQKPLSKLEELIESLNDDPRIEEVHLSYIISHTLDSDQPNTSTNRKYSKVDYKKDPWNKKGKKYQEWNSDTPDGSNWWAEAVKMPSVWEQDLNLVPVKVGIIDSMFDLDNTDLKPSFVKTWYNPTDKDGLCKVPSLYANKPSDKNMWHGTAVAGIIAAEGANNYGITGVSRNAKLYGFSLKGDFAEEKIDIPVFKYKYAIATLLNENVKVINISMGWGNVLVNAQKHGKDVSKEWENFVLENAESFSRFLRKYIDRNVPFIICKSAGNQSFFYWDYDVAYDLLGAIKDPIVSERIIVVGAVSNHNDLYKGIYRNIYTVANYSNTGDRVDVYAPGSNVLSIVPDHDKNTVKSCDGTSFSTPIVSGAAALIWGLKPDLSSEQVASIIKSSVDFFSLDHIWEADRFIIEGIERAVPILDVSACIRFTMITQPIQEKEQTEEYGTLIGYIDTIDNINVRSFAVLDQNGQKVCEVDVNKERVETKKEEDGFAYLNTFSELLPAGTYTIKLDIQGYDLFEEKITITNRRMTNVYPAPKEMLSIDKRELIDEYISFIQSQTNALSYSIYDIDKDGYPEVFIEVHGDRSLDYNIYSYREGRFIFAGYLDSGWHSLPVLASYPEGNGVLSHFYYKGREIVQLSTWKDGVYNEEVLYVEQGTSLYYGGESDKAFDDSMNHESFINHQFYQSENTVPFVEGSCLLGHSAVDNFTAVYEAFEIKSGEDNSQNHSESNTQTIVVGDKVEARITPAGDQAILIFDSDDGELWGNWQEKIGEWNVEISSIEFSPDSGKLYLPQDSKKIFSGLSSLKSIDMSMIDTSRVVNMESMFAGCLALESADFSQIDTSSVTDMSGMFYLCSNMEMIDLTHFNTSNVTDMGYMFFESGVKALDLSGFDTSKVTCMSCMFDYCSAISELDLSGFNTSNVTDMNAMFYSCRALERLDLSNFDTANVSSYNNMFLQCDQLQIIKTPGNNELNIPLPVAMYDSNGNMYENLPTSVESMVISKAGVEYVQ